MDEYKGAWHGDPDLKERTLAKMKRHRALDEFIQGYYQVHDPKTASGFKGCALGCMVDKQPVNYIDDWVDSYNTPMPVSNGITVYWAVEKDLGIPIRAAEEIDLAFEDCPGFEAAGDFAIAVVEAIPVGADWRTVDLENLYVFSEDRQDFLEKLAKLPSVGE